MNGSIGEMGSPSGVRRRRSLARIYALEAWYEWLKMVRLPAYVAPTLLFPIVFYLIFGVALRSKAAVPGGFDISSYLLATYGAFGAMNAALFNFGVSVAVERGQGWALFKRATPMPPLAHLVGRLTVCLAFSTLIVGSLFALGAGLAEVRLPAATWLALAGTLIAGSAVFAAFGLAIGYWVGPNSAPAVVNLISMPMSIASGLWIPLAMLPQAMRRLAPLLPTYHYARLGLRVLGFSTGGSATVSVVYLVLFAAASLVAAWIGFRRDEGRTYG